MGEFTTDPATVTHKHVTQAEGGIINAGSNIRALNRSMAGSSTDGTKTLNGLWSKSSALGNRERVAVGEYQVGVLQIGANTIRTVRARKVAAAQKRTAACVAGKVSRRRGAHLHGRVLALAICSTGYRPDGHTLHAPVRQGFRDGEYAAPRSPRERSTRRFDETTHEDATMTAMRRRESRSEKLESEAREESIFGSMSCTKTPGEKSV